MKRNLTCVQEIGMRKSELIQALKHLNGANKIFNRISHGIGGQTCYREERLGEQGRLMYDKFDDLDRQYRRYHNELKGLIKSIKGHKKFLVDKANNIEANIEGNDLKKWIERGKAETDLFDSLFEDND